MGFLIPLCLPLLLLMKGGLIKGQDFFTKPQDYTTVTAKSTREVATTSLDPCTNYTSLDQPWRSSNATGSGYCDYYFNWNGWYRLFYYGMDVHMSESCVPYYRCGTYYTMWLNGPHPQIEDGVVTRQVCGNVGYDCCYFSSTQIRVKACPGNYYVYELVRPYYCSAAYCTDTSTLNLTATPATPFGIESTTTASNTPDISTSDPCSNYNVLDDAWRTIFSYYSYSYYTYGYSWYYSSHDDTTVEWNGWYRIYLQGLDAQIPEWCVYYMTSGGYTPLLLGGTHPLIEDGIVTREIYGSYSYGYYSGQCNYYRSNPIQVKACPGHYYVYKLVKPNVSIPMPTYTAVALNRPSYDPCNNYVSLDQPWRANNGTVLNICDRNFNWNGWYRLFYHGMNIRMPESCVNISTCGTYNPLWLNGPHPEIEDGVVTRQVCGNEGYDCCYFKSTPIRVKACPGNYYVYEFVTPITCSMAYCTDVHTITPTPPPPTEAIPITTIQDNSMFDPCNDYSVLNDYWRSTRDYYGGHDDTLVQWNGWYRLYLLGTSAQLPEWCVSFMTCGGYTPLSLGGSHPQPEDGIVTREVYGSNGSQCTTYRSKPIQVKACPGDYYVYKFVRPDVSIPMPSYCAVTVAHSSYDPCNNYTSLDQPWRASNETGRDICDLFFNWNGWYRLFYYGMNIRLSESCVPVYRCGSYYTLWINGPHPQIEDGVVTRQLCGNAGYDCYYFRSTTIQVKACPGDYYVYELVRPDYCNMAYCTDANTTTPTLTPTATNEFSINTTNSPTEYDFDPCENYTALDDTWRNMYTHNRYNSHDDTVVEWSGWYRLYLESKSAQLPEWCVTVRTCGGYTSLYINGSHPRLQDGIVTREIHGSLYSQCGYYRSNPIQIKACPGHYYVYKLVRPVVSIPMPTYCAVAFNHTSYDPCYNYTSLDQPWRANNATGLNIFDRYFNWNGWYRLFYYGMDIHMSESCVSTYRCGAYYTLWLNGPHPEIEDGVVVRQVCGNSGQDCCQINFLAIQVKACPGNYYVYEFRNPTNNYNNYYYYYYNYYYFDYNYYYYYHYYYYSSMAYCTDASAITPTSAPRTNTVDTGFNMTMTNTSFNYTSDPCYDYAVLDDNWRSIYNTYSGHDDTTIEWNGWYRLYFQGSSAQLSEWCVSYRTCGGYTPLVLDGSHPQEQDGIVARNIHAFTDYNCNQASRSNPIQVKACPGRYYVYKLVKPDVSIPMPTYCTVAFNYPSNDPCYNYNVLDQPFRATNNADRNVYPYYWWWWWYSWCDAYTSWNGWYRLLYQGNNTQMPESCVREGMCGTDIPLWLNNPHPRLEDGVVTRRICGSSYGDCCYFKSYPIQIKACPGNYYVYEFVSPVTCSSAYCSDAGNISTLATTGMNCPVNSHYELCGTDCGHTCDSSINAVCERNCSEGCFCNKGFVRSGGRCVPVEECGCLYNGSYHHIGNQFWTPGCSQRCKCFAHNDLRCSSASCSSTQECAVRHGRLGCYSTMSSCMVWGDPHYLTFDGAVITFQGTCSYEISKTCGNISENGLVFRVVATNMHRGNMAVSFASKVDVWLSQRGQQANITIGQNKRVKVNRTDMDSSAFQINYFAEVYQEQDFVVVNASSELMVYFDGRFTLLVKLGPSLNGSVCGMCGNNNGDPADDKALPSGDLASNDNVLGNSWRSDISAPGCGANDRTVDVNDCLFRQESFQFCSVITNTSGPFQLCHIHINPVLYYNSCIYDMCVYSSENNMLCSAVEAYEVACTMMGLEISEWRPDLGCSRVDPCAEMNCTADEWCGKKDGIYGCFCNENNPRPKLDSYDSRETCESSSGTMSLSRCQLFEAGFPANVLHLSDPRCNGTLQNGRLVFHFDNDENICGTNLTANGTHFIYENSIQVVMDSIGGPINRQKHLELRFSCVYQLSQTVTMDTELNPLLSILHKTLPNGQGLYQVRITPFQDAAFSHPYNGTAKIEVDQRIYVGVIVQGVDSRQIATVIDSCWATPVKDQNFAVRWDLIINRCPNPKDITVEVLQNGVSTSGRFSFKMFAFNGYRKVFLHCAVHLCLLQGNNCASHCFPGHHRRVGRSVNIHDSTSISVGPFIWTTENAGV